jgi:NAD-dependent SIR2 family protein deacetylase
MFHPDLLNTLRKARHIAVFTGAGVSAESGIPTFRDTQSGLWKQFDATRLSSPQTYRTDKALVWGWYEWRRMKVLQAASNPVISSSSSYHNASTYSKSKPLFRQALAPPSRLVKLW